MVTNAVAPDKLGGLERYVRELSAALVARDLDVTVLSKQTDASQPLEEVGGDGVRIVRHRVPSKKSPTFALQYPFTVAAAVRREIARRPDAILHGHYAITSLPLAFGRRPYVYTFHAPVFKEMLSERQGSYALPGFVQKPAVSALRAAERQVLTKADKVIVLSDFMRRQLLAFAHAADGAVRLMPGGIDVERFSEGPAYRDEWASAASPLLFTARRLTLRTGVLELVQAMPLVLAEHPHAMLAIAGSGGQQDRIEQEIRALGLERRVRLLGRVGDEDLLRWYRVADLAVTPTQELEGFGLSTAEALACGTPTLVTPVGANPELVVDLDPLMVATGADPRPLGQSISSLMAHPDVLERVRSRAHSYAEERWSWDVVADQHLEMYASHIDDREAKAAAGSAP